MRSLGVSLVLAVSAALVYVAVVGGGGSASPASAARRNPPYDNGGSASPASAAQRNPPYVDRGMPVFGDYSAPQQVDVVAEPPAGAIAPGQRFALMVSVTPRAKMHVYAPGADGYRTVALTIAPSPYVRIRALVYPKSEIYEFKPLNERVPAYEKPFTLVQQMTLDGSAATRAALRDQKALTITGRFDYQACDDGTCYNPATVPLTWTIQLK